MSDTLRELEQILSAPSVDRRVALIAIDQPVEDDLITRLRELGCLLGHLPQDREWFATTPVRLQLRDGGCVSAGVIERW